MKANCLELSCGKITESTWRILSAVFVMIVEPQTKIFVIFDRAWQHAKDP